MIAAPAFGQVEEEERAGQEAEHGGQQVSGGGKTERDREQYDARLPLVAGSLQRVGYADCRVGEAVEPPQGENLIVGRGGVADDGRAEAVECEREGAAGQPEQALGHPPQAAAEPYGEQAEGQAKQPLDRGDLVAKLPWGAVQAASVEAVVGTAEVVGRQ